MSASKHIVPPEQLTGTLLAILRVGPRTADELARATGYSSNAIRERLCELRSLGHTHRKTQPRPAGGMHYVWHAGEPIGPLPGLVKARPKRNRNVDEPHQVIVKDFGPFPYRDGLVAALFGPAHKEAA